MNIGETILEEKFAYLFALKKKIKTMVETVNYVEKGCYEEVLSAEDLSKHEQKTQKIVEKWNQNPEEGELTAEILEVSSQINNLMERYDDETKKIIKRIGRKSP